MIPAGAHSRQRERQGGRMAGAAAEGRGGQRGGNAHCSGPGDPLCGVWLFLSVKWEAIKGLSSSVKVLAVVRL